MAWTLPFSEQIDNAPIPSQFRELTYISGANNHLSCKLFPGTLRGVVMRWFPSLPPLSVTSFVSLVATFESQCATNKTKRLEVAKFSRTKTLKQYSACFNIAMVQVDDPDQKFFVKAFQKGVAMQWFSGLPLLSVTSFVDLATTFKS
ncbi:hypothetical protein CR513_51257, partial [Mucuna pruriens]